MLGIEGVAQLDQELITHADRKRVRFYEEAHASRFDSLDRGAKQLGKARQQVADPMAFRGSLRSHSFPDQNITRSKRVREIRIRLQTVQCLLELVIVPKWLKVGLAYYVQSAHGD